jgi:hypothetical protein
LGCPEDDQPVIDVIDRCCPQVMEKCLGMLPPAEKAAALSISNVDLQWIADRSSCVWTAGNFYERQKLVWKVRTLVIIDIFMLFITLNYSAFAGWMYRMINCILLVR